MVKPLTLILILLATGLVRADEPELAPVPEVGSALSKGSFRWYDSAKDQAKTIDVPRERTDDPWPTARPGPSFAIGDLVSIVGFAVAIVVLVGLLLYFYRFYEPSDEARTTLAVKQVVTGQVVEELPVGLRDEFKSSDPWREAIRRRAQGDLAGAIVCLFAHQLLTLSRLGLVRLAPGRTCRQLVKAVADAEFRGLVHPTLRLFEGVYYGHLTPTLPDFDAVWAGAEAFERRVAAGGLP